MHAGKPWAWECRIDTCLAGKTERETVRCKGMETRGRKTSMLRLEVYSELHDVYLKKKKTEMEQNRKKHY